MAKSEIREIYFTSAVESNRPALVQYFSRTALVAINYLHIIGRCVYFAADCKILYFCIKLFPVDPVN